MSEPEELRTLRVLNAVMRSLIAGSDYDQALDRIMGELLTAVRAERGFLVLTRGEDLDFRAVRNWAREDLEAAPGEVSRSIVRDVLSERRSTLLEDAMQSDYGELASVQALKLASILASPLLRPEDGSPFGVLYLEARAEARRFSAADKLLVEEVLAVSSRALSEIARRHDLEERARSMESALLAKDRFPGIVTSAPAMLAVLKTVAQIGSSEVPVLIVGESGTGKELVARAVHLNSARADGPFLAVNCGAFSGELLEAELFGHQKGAFTGASKDRPGLFRAAHGGSLFLDELGEMPAPLQVKLLRAVQFGELRPIGSDTTYKADVRIISATNRDLEQAVAAGAFRQDLLYRLNAITLELPPLRERPDDIALIVEHVLERSCKERNIPRPTLPSETREALLRYSWPGNVRELENEIARLLALARGPDGPFELSRHITEAAPDAGDPRHLQSRVAEEEKRAILEALEKENGNRTRAAKRLGVSRETLRIKMRRFDLV